MRKNVTERAAKIPIALQGEMIQETFEVETTPRQFAMQKVLEKLFFQQFIAPSKILNEKKQTQLIHQIIHLSNCYFKISSRYGSHGQ